MNSNTSSRVRRNSGDAYFDEIGLVLGIARKSKTRPVPNVLRIDIVDSAAIAVIVFGSKTVKRRMRDFKWLWRTLCTNCTQHELIPDLPDSAIEKNVPLTSELTQCKSDLNGWLLQCEQSEWIKQYEAYTIFLADDKDFRWLRHRYDQRVIMTANKMMRRKKTCGKYKNCTKIAGD